MMETKAPRPSFSEKTICVFTGILLLQLSLPVNIKDDKKKKQTCESIVGSLFYGYSFKTNKNSNSISSRKS